METTEDVPDGPAAAVPAAAAAPDPAPAEVDSAAGVVLDDCAAVRGIVNDDQGGPLHPPGLRMAEALNEFNRHAHRRALPTRIGLASGEILLGNVGAVERLEYRGPELLLEAVRTIRGTRLRLGSVLDLGCGTGLGGAAFRPFCDWLVGVDISPGMIEQARAKGLYDRLAVADLLEGLTAEAGASHHLALAADVFVYCSDLAPIAKAVARVLAPGGLFAFTVETHDDPGVRLQGTLRYAHGATHAHDAAAAAGLELRQLTAASTRNEKGAPVAGLLVVASAPPSSPSNCKS